jgi:hypothetical protein
VTTYSYDNGLLNIITMGNGAGTLDISSGGFNNSVNIITMGIGPDTLDISNGGFNNHSDEQWRHAG